MPKQFLDRADPLKGINRTSRDVRVPYTSLRSAENFRLPDGRLERRPGFSNISEERQIHGNQLTKHTATIIDYEQVDEANRKIRRIKSPLSYGLIKWHDDFQPKTTRSWTLEFLATLGEVEVLTRATDDYSNESQGTYSTGPERLYLRPERGVVLFDQSVLANRFTFQKVGWPGTETPKSAIAGASPAYCDVFVLSTLAVSVEQSGFHFQICLIDNSNIYYPYNYNLRTLFGGLESWSTGTFHIAITYDHTSRFLSIFINGSLRNGQTIPANHFFLGERDAINNNTTAIQRDIVLLNECTARGGYASTCRVNASSIGGSGIVAADHGYYTLPHYFKDNTTANNTLIPWCHSPPKGTGLSELRIWHEARNVDAIDTYKYSSVDPESSNLVGYWKLDDGSSVCKPAISGDHRYCTLHHGIGGYVSDQSMVNGVGLVLADGQCLRNEYAKTDYLYVRDSHIALRSLFTTDTTTNYAARQDFLVQMQIRTPSEWQQELNQFSGSATIAATSGDTRQHNANANYVIKDGLSVARTVREDTGVGSTFLRAFDSTLFSIEGTMESSISQADSIDDKRRVPLVRGLLTPNGTIVFEYYVYAGAVAPRLYRLVSNTALAKDTVYTLTFERKTKYDQNTSGGGNTGKVTASAVTLAIYLNNSTTADRSLDISGVNASPMQVGYVSDVLIGASQFADANDRSVSNRASEVELGQRFMSPYQDQPGFFTLGFFRMWAGSVGINEVAVLASRTLSDTDTYGKSLLFNLEVDASSQDQIVSRTPYSDTFQLYYKGWGEPEYQDILGQRSSHPGAWYLEDRLGYSAKSSLFEGTTEAQCNGLMSFSSVLRQSRGLLAIFDSAAFYNTTVQGGLNPLLMTSRGLLNDFRDTGYWRGSSIGDRTILTSEAGFPKVFTGGTFSYLGFPRWTGGMPQVDAQSPGGSLQASKWYGVRIVYVSEKFGIQQYSPAVAVSTNGGNLQLQIRNVPAHPDPRISSFRIYVTQAQDAKDAALQGVYYPILDAGTSSPGATFENKFLALYTYSAESIVTGAPLDLTFTPPPNCPYSAALNGRLYLAGGLIPDAVYWSDAGNPENFNTAVNTLIIDEATGDRINGLIALFATLYVFKANSIWRVTEVGAGEHQMEKVADVGSISDRSVAVVTLPDTGRTGIVFWSRFGPYLFDGINLQYLGYELEGEGEPYQWMDPDSVHVAHDIVRRELIFIYKSSGENGTSAYHDRASVFNYRFSSWVEYSGMSFSAALATTFVAVSSAPNIGFNQNYSLILGGVNGHVYEWATDTKDGLHSTAPGNEYTVSSYVDGDLTITDASAMPNNILRGCWMTIVKEDQSKWYTVRIIDNLSGVLSLDIATNPPTWTMGAGDRAYICLPMAFAEFPWDELDMAHKDKRVGKLTTWNSQEFLVNYKTDWRSVFDKEWLTLDDAESSRQHTALLDGYCESIKLYLASVQENAKLLNYGYEIEFTNEGNSPQR